MHGQEILANYHCIDKRQLKNFAAVSYYSKMGVRGFPDLHPGVLLMAQKADLASQRLIDATGTAGLLALIARARHAAKQVLVLEPSAAALRCAMLSFVDDSAVEVAAGAPWDAAANSADLICLTPPTDRGSERVRAELIGAHTALKMAGAALIVMHKDQGAKRYEKLAKDIFGELEVLAKSGGWRLARAVKRTSEAPQLSTVSFRAAGLNLTVEPGVFAAGKFDPGTALFLDTVDMMEFSAKQVLDIGCGYGILALKASLAGAAVTALDDDLLAVRSSYKNARHYGLDVRCLHSDVDAALKEDERFDAILMNPPFHVAKAVQLLLPRAFLAAAHKHLKPGGILTLVANRALAYEQDLADWPLSSLAENKQFKVIKTVKP